MQCYYGTLMPLRMLDEMELWKRQEIRNVILMRDLIDEDSFIAECENWKDTITITHRHINRFMNSVTRNDLPITQELHQQTLDMATFSLQESMAFKQFCGNVLDECETMKDCRATPIVIKHLIEESNDFITTAQKILYED